jgi:hypothetical protein
MKWFKNLLKPDKDFLVEREREEELAKANFKEEDGVSCLVNKMVEDIEENPHLWRVEYANGECFTHAHKASKIVIYSNRNCFCTGSIILSEGNEEVTFSINHTSCARFTDTYERIERDRRQMLKQKALGRWGVSDGNA